MPGTWFEKTGSRHVTNSQVQRQYYGENIADETEVSNYVGSLPETLANLPFSDFDGKENDKAEGDYDLTVTWGSPSKQEQKPAGTSSYGFSFQAPTARIKRSLATISATEDATVFTFGPPPMHGAINVVDYGTADVHTDGLDLQPPGEVFKIPYTDVDAVIDAAYQSVVRDLCGKVNSVNFYGVAAGQIMLVRASGEKKNGLWNLEFGFGYIANATNIPVGDNIVVPQKDGMDYLWALEITGKHDATKSLIQQPVCAYVERVFERANLNLLNLP